VFEEQGIDALAVANIDVDRQEGIELALELLLYRRGSRVGTEEIRAHVVVDTDHVIAPLGEIARGLRSDKSGRASDDRRWHRATVSRAPPEGLQTCAEPYAAHRASHATARLQRRGPSIPVHNGARGVLTDTWDDDAGDVLGEDAGSERSNEERGARRCRAGRIRALIGVGIEVVVAGSPPAADEVGGAGSPWALPWLRIGVGVRWSAGEGFVLYD
jgi:hypothetical protein